MVWMLDKIAVPTALAGFFIRMGNLMNSEILGKQTDVSWAFIFVREGDGVPRHPTQLYESLAYLGIFFILYFVYWKTEKRHQPGYLFGAFMMLVWGVRFFLEFIKESQGGFESALGQSLSTGQWLSIPFVLIGAYFVFRPWDSLKKI
jgi:prolipoprotein diacylglyceryltransferase